jgi:rhamnulokinase
MDRILPARERFRLTGTYPNNYLVVNQVYWGVKNGFAASELCAVFLPLPSLYHYWFSGQQAVEPTWLTTGQLGSCHSRTYCQEVFERLGLPANKMPPLVPTGHDLGPCHPELAASLGLPPFRVILPASHDTACAFAAAPLRSGRPALVISAGTWWCMGTILPTPMVSDAAYANAFSNVLGVEGVVFNQISMGSLPAQHLRSQWSRLDGQEMSWETYNQLAAACYRPDLDFAIDDLRLRTSLDMVETVTAVAGQAPGSLSRGELAALVYAGLARKTARLVQVLGEIIGQEIKEIVVVGGGARNDYMNQYLADASGLPVRTGSPDATSLGNALVQATTLGWFTSPAEGLEAVRNTWEEKVFTPVQHRQQ